MEDVLEVYERPYDKKNPVICIDEKPVPLIEDTREHILPCKDGDVLKKDYEYGRNGSVNVFCCVELKAGVYINTVIKNRSGGEFAKFLSRVALKYNSSKKIILIMDNLSTHKEKSLTKYYGEKEGKRLWKRFEIHYTPKHESWLNQAEIAIGMYSRQCLGDGRIGTLENLKFQTKVWNKRINQKGTKINWRFTRSKTRKSFDYARQHSEKFI